MRIQLTGAGGTADHQNAHREKAWKLFSDKIDNLSEKSADSFDQILSYKKDRLNGANVSRTVVDHGVAIVEIVGERFFNKLVVAVVFAPISKSPRPRIQLSDAHECRDSDRSSGKRNGNVIVHREGLYRRSAP